MTGKAPVGRGAARATQVRVLRGQAPGEVGAALQSWRPNLLYLSSGLGAGGALLPLRLQPAAAAAAAAAPASNDAAAAHGLPAPVAEAGAEHGEGVGGHGSGGAEAASEGRVGDAADDGSAPMDTDGGRRSLLVACAASRSAGCCCRFETGYPCAVVRRGGQLKWPTRGVPAGRLRGLRAVAQRNPPCTRRQPAA